MKATCLTLALIFLHALTAHAWHDLGHETVAAIAWDQMTPQARNKAVALLQSALVHFPDGRVLILSDDGAMKVKDEEQKYEEQKELLKKGKKKISELSFRSAWLTP